MSFMINKVKSELQLKSKASKKKLEHGVALAAIAASSPDDLLPKMTLERRKISSLKNLKKRTRKSEKAQVEKVSRSLRSYGQIAPILINDQGEIINGHIVAEAMRHLGMQDVLCVIVENLDEHQCAQIHIALNGSVKGIAPASDLAWHGVVRGHASPSQASQPVPLFSVFARGDPSRGDDVCPLPVVAAER